jgi:hypothetical protein
MKIRNVRPYRATTTSGPVVVVSTTYADAKTLLESMGYEITDLRGVRPLHRDRWYNVISPWWQRVEHDDTDWWDD